MNIYILIVIKISCLYSKIIDKNLLQFIKGLHRHWHWFRFNVFDVKKMNIETQCDVSVFKNFNIEFDSMFSMFQCWFQCFNVEIFPNFQIVHGKQILNPMLGFLFLIKRVKLVLKLKFNLPFRPDIF